MKAPVPSQAAAATIRIQKTHLLSQIDNDILDDISRRSSRLHACGGEASSPDRGRSNGGSNEDSPVNPVAFGIFPELRDGSRCALGATGSFLGLFGGWWGWLAGLVSSGAVVGTFSCSRSSVAITWGSW